MAKKTTPAATALVPPAGGAIVRMYRIGHGDCFLVAFAGDSRPVYVLIDCGYKPGSPNFIKAKSTNPDDVVADIRAVTGGHIDVAIITHEHQDHVNAITKKRFAGVTIGETWFAWTESENDKLAKQLRKDFKDRLKALALASNRLAASADQRDKDLSTWINELVALEIGGERPVTTASMALAAAADGAWTNKDAMKLFRDLAKDGVKCLYPHRQILSLPGAKHVRVFPLGPPYNEKEIEDLDPQGAENFRKKAVGPSLELALSSNRTADGNDRPFAARYGVAIDQLKKDPATAAWYKRRYGTGKTLGDAFDPNADRQAQISNNARFRRIDLDWLQSAEHLALAMGDYTNNSSLVLAFELGKGGKVLLFAADAQRGNWASWAKKSFKDGTSKVSVRELLGRTVLYKVGHHGSHNATLDGKAGDAVPNLSWLGRGEYASEFTAMITAVRAWAMQPTVKWDHPLKAIKDALIEKADGRVFQTDTDFGKMKRPAGAGKTAWNAFQKRAHGSVLYFDLRIDA